MAPMAPLGSSTIAQAQLITEEAAICGMKILFYKLHQSIDSSFGRDSEKLVDSRTASQALIAHCNEVGGRSYKYALVRLAALEEEVKNHAIESSFQACEDAFVKVGASDRFTVLKGELEKRVRAHPSHSECIFQHCS
jgi:hypothetical protein